MKKYQKKYLIKRIKNRKKFLRLMDRLIRIGKKMVADLTKKYQESQDKEFYDGQIRLLVSSLSKLTRGE